MSRLLTRSPEYRTVCWRILATLLLIALPGELVAAEGYVSGKMQADAFTLSAKGKSAALYVSSQDYAGVARVARLLQQDLLRVTGNEPPLSIDGIAPEKEMVLIGTLGRSPWVDRLVREKRLDVGGIAGKWETFLIQTIKNPLPGIDRALVIAGSDKRGTIYGMFDLASKAGVSPWYWWADVPAKKEPELFVLPGRYSNGQPAVKYRGIFINDEAPALSGWTREKFGGFNSAFYEHVFELILRLKGNFLWPAMWGNAFYDDDQRNPQLADEFGIVIGTSHHEPMMRAHDEWRRYGSGPWNYEKNDSMLRSFWRQGIARMGLYESLVTVGMRGDGDEPMSEGANIALLENIVRDQRRILGEVTGKDPAAIPQVWALYKEVQEYYDKGMRVPDDVTLLLCDDNWGNIRRLPSLLAPPRAGGYGIYYHFDYVGGPRNYKWVNTNQIARVWEQMHMAYAYGARRIWIVNVGDIKPMEFPTQFFLDYAWNPDEWSAERLPAYTRQWAAQQFGEKHAKDIAEILSAYSTYNSRRKPELLAPDTYSLVNYREAATVVDDYTRLAERAQRIYESLPPAQKDAFYQLVLHPVTACANLNDLYVTVGTNHLYAGQGRTGTNALADRAAFLFSKDSAISHYYNSTLAGGKWNHMMDQTHISYTSWQQPEKDVPPPVQRIALKPAPEMGVAIEGSTRWWPWDTTEAVLPECDPYSNQSTYIEVFNRGALPVHYVLHSPEKYLQLSSREGSVRTEERVTVNVDWRKAPAGKQRVPITITGPDSTRVVVHAVVNNPVLPKRQVVHAFMESNGYVSMEAEHYTTAVNTPYAAWQRIPDLGRTLSAMTVTPVTSASVAPGGDSPRLEYRVHLFTAGRLTVHAYLSPTLDFRTEPGREHKGLCYAVSFDEQQPQIINMHAKDTVPDWKYPHEWNQAVANNIHIVTSQHTAEKPGEHILKFWMVDPGVVLQKLVIDAGGMKPSYLGPPESFYAGAVRKWKDKKMFFNPILAGFYPDPSICRVGADYYLVTSTFAYFPGIPVFQSRDLVNWNLIGHVLDRAEQLNLDGQGVSRGLFAPAIRYRGGKFYVTCTLVDIGGNFVATATSPGGPWSNPVWIPEINGIDPSMFFDDDDRAYIIYNSIPPNDKPLYDGHRTIRMYEFDTGKLKVTGEEHLLVNGGADIARNPVWIEAPHIFKKDAAYFLIAAEGGTGDQHSEVVFRSATVEGPYVPFAGNPILTQRHLDPAREAPITSTGHADFVQTESGDWWAVFLGCRPYPPVEGGHYNTGRETFLAPVQWKNGWPIVTTGEEKVQYSYPYPVRPSSAPGVPYGGNFTRRDDFDGGTLGRDWAFLRTPHEEWYDLRSRKGFVGLKLRPESCSGGRNPSFLGRRQQHLRGSASTAMLFSPDAENQKAGIVVFQNESHFYFLCKSKVGTSPQVQLYTSLDAGGSTTHMRLIASRKITVKENTVPLRLKIEARGDTYAFQYGFGDRGWSVLKEHVDAKFLSTKVAGGFVGCMYGLYATSLGKKATTSAYYDWFEYRGNDDIYMIPQEQAGN